MASMLKAKEDALSRHWVVVKRQGAAFTGGALAVFPDGVTAACQCSDRVALLSLSTGLVTQFIPGDAAAAQAEPIQTFAVSPDGLKLFTCSRSLMLRVWSPTTGECVRSWKGHRMPVQVAEFDATSTLVATGGSDRMVMVWDTDGGYATHSFRGHEGVVSCVRFVPHPHSVERLVSAAEDGGVIVWDLLTQTAVVSIKEHVAAVTSLLFSPDASGYTMLTAGRDGVVHIFDTRDFDVVAAANTGGAQRSAAATVTAKATVPTYEAIEAAVMLPAGTATASGAAGGTASSMQFVTAGEKGLLREWELSASGEGKSRRYAVACVATRAAQELRGAKAAPSGKPGASAADAETALSRQFAALMLRPVPQQLAAATGATDTQSKKRKRAEDSTSSSAASAANVELLAVTRDQVISLVRPRDLSLSKSVVGFNDEFTDLRYIPKAVTPAAASDADGGERAGRSAASAGAASEATAGHHAVHSRNLVVAATNSEQLRIVDVDSFDTRLCDGHTGVVLSVAASPDGTLVASASKDRTIRVWDVATSACVAVCEGHTEIVTAVSFPSRASAFLHAGNAPKGAIPATMTSWVASAGKDRTLKVWQLAPLLAKLPSPRPASWDSAAVAAVVPSPHSARTMAATIAHDKDVNAVAVAPHDRLIATASQDKTIKLWSAPDLAPVATLHGHKRGVWSIAFSPADQLLASASGDKTVRLWAVSAASGFACLRTFEGHDGSVLCVRFLRRGAQLVTGGADGLIKLWSIRDSECVATLDAHTEKVWALAVQPLDATAAAAAASSASAPASGQEDVETWETQMVSGGGDSVLNVWKDASSATAQNEVEAAEAALRKQQSLFTAMASRNYTRAITLTLELDQPGRCGDILQELLEVGPTPARNITQVDDRFRSDMLAEVHELRAQDEGTADSQRSGSSNHAEGEAKLVGLLKKLKPHHLVRLLGYVREWNAQSRHGILAQRVLSLILRHIQHAQLVRALVEARKIDAEAITKMLPGIGSIQLAKAQGALALTAELTPIVNPVEVANDRSANGPPPATAAAAELKQLIAALLPYSQRHMERVDRLMVSTYLMDTLTDAMQVLKPLPEQEHALSTSASNRRAKVGPSAAMEGVSSDEDEDSDSDSAAEESAAARWRKKAPVRRVAVLPEGKYVRPAPSGVAAVARTPLAGTGGAAAAEGESRLALTARDALGLTGSPAEQAASDSDNDEQVDDILARIKARAR